MACDFLLHQTQFTTGERFRIVAFGVIKSSQSDFHKSFAHYAVEQYFEPNDSWHTIKFCLDLKECFDTIDAKFCPDV